MDNSSNKGLINQKCVWMSAGIINYKLCNCQYECETCDFDKVMLLKNNVETAAQDFIGEEQQNPLDRTENFQINRYLTSLLSDVKIYMDRFYHPTHFWYKIESDTMITVGINKLLLKILEPVRKIKLPEVGEMFERGQMHSCIVRGQMSLPLNSPVSGKIIEINERIPYDDLRQTPFYDDYYFKMEVSDIKEEIRQFCTSICGLKYFMDIISLLRKYLRKTFNQNPSAELGITMTDGGKLQRYLENVIGEEDYHRLLTELF